MAQQALRRQHEQRQRIEIEQRRLPAQQVEILRGGRAVDEAQIGVGRGLEDALGARVRVLGPLAFVAVREQEHQRRRQPPLRAAGGDELVEHHLRAVDEVAVLRFPDHQAPRLLHVVAELEADGRVLGERAVVKLERRARLRKLLQRHQLRSGIRVVEHRVALAEGAALDVLAGHADRNAVGQDRRQRQLLGGGPVDRALAGVVECLPALVARPFQLAVKRKPVRTRQQRVVDLAQAIERHAGDDLCRRARRRMRRKRRRVILFGLERRVGRFERLEVLLHQRVRQLGGNGALLDERARPDFPDGRVRGDRSCR